MCVTMYSEVGEVTRRRMGQLPAGQSFSACDTAF